MKVKLIATATDLNQHGFKEFKRSLNHFGWDYEIISKRYIAYGSKMKNAYEYALQTDCSHLFIVDAYDVFMLGTPQEALDSIENKDVVLFNAEKACWPHVEWAKEYPVVHSTWKYLNGGACFVDVELFKKLFEENPIKDTDNDQEVLGRIYLDKRDKYNMKLDSDCKVFQSIAFEHEDDFEYLEDAGRLYNKETGSLPVIIHGNGKTPMEKVYKLL